MSNESVRFVYDGDVTSSSCGGLDAVRACDGTGISDALVVFCCLLLPTPPPPPLLVLLLLDTVVGILDSSKDMLLRPRLFIGDTCLHVKYTEKMLSMVERGLLLSWITRR